MPTFDILAEMDEFKNAYAAICTAASGGKIKEYIGVFESKGTWIYLRHQRDDMGSWNKTAYPILVRTTSLDQQYIIRTLLSYKEYTEELFLDLL